MRHISLLLLLALVVLIRLPFLRQAVQGDDIYYIAIARNSLVDPLHPLQMGLTFQGVKVSMAGHPHPPLNASVLGLLLRVFGRVREFHFHLIYLLFSLVSAAAMYSLARHFTGRPFVATLLFISVPAFVVNGSSFEADFPFLAFWMLGFALYIGRRHLLGAGALAIAAFGAYQAVFAAPILALHAWYQRRQSRTAWIAVAAAPAALAFWQIFERAGAGHAPAGVLAGYFSTYGLLDLMRKVHSALALTAHLGWTSFPLATLGVLGLSRITLPAALVLAGVLRGYLVWQRVLLAVSFAAGLTLAGRWARDLIEDRKSDSGFLAAWGLAFFAGAVAVFYAGSARYLLPLAAPAALALTRAARRTWLLWAGAVCNLVLGLAMAAANYQYAESYRRIASDLRPLVSTARLWSNAEWGLRYYLEQIGGEPLERGQPIYPGSFVVTSDLAGAAVFSTEGGRLETVLRALPASRLPIRLIGLGARSGYSSSEFGVLPFDFGNGPVDSVRAGLVGAPDVRLSDLQMGDPEAASQLLSGFYQIESGAWRWMAGEAGVLLRPPPAGATRLDIAFAIPGAAPARRITVSIEGATPITKTYPGPGQYTFSAPVRLEAGPAVRVTIGVDKTLKIARDNRTLGIIVQDVALR